MRALAFVLSLTWLALLVSAPVVRAEDTNTEDYRLEGLSTWPGGYGSGGHHHGHSSGTGSSGGTATSHAGDRNCPHSISSAVVEPGAPNRAGRYDSIARALCAVVTDGTVYIHPGVYAEQFNVYRGVTLWGIDHRAGGLGQPVVQGAPNAGCNTIYASGDVTIRNVGFHGGTNGGGCLAAEGGSLTLDHVTIAGNNGGTGLLVRNTSTTIVESEIRNLRDGIVVTYGSESGTLVSLRDSRVLYNRTGLVLEAQANIEVTDNMFFGNEDFAIYMQSGEGQISGNRIFRNGTGLFLLERRPSQVLSNFFAGNNVAAFAPFSPGGGLFSRNRFECNGVDIRDGEYYGNDYDADGYESPVCAALYEY